MQTQLSGRTILVTGAAGFIGSAIVRRLASIPCTLRCLIHRSPAPALAVDEMVATLEVVTGDVRDHRVWVDSVKDVDVIFHLACQTSVYEADAHPEEDLAANVRPVLHLTEACRASGNHPIVVAAGTATVVGLTTETSPISEDRADQPITFYDIHKWVGERYFEGFSRQGILRATTLRLANVYGPGPPGSPDRGFINAMIKCALSGQPLSLYGSGEFVRDYVYVDDVAEAFIAAAAAIERTGGEHFVVGSGYGTTLAEALHVVADRATKKTGRLVPIVSTPPPSTLSPIERRNFVADPRRLHAATGWTARVSLEEGVDRTIRDLLEGALS